VRFRDRREAGSFLAKRLMRYAGQPDILVLALPRGGVPVAFEVAQALPAPLDVFIVRKLGMPGHEELAMGAIASGGVRVLNEDLVRLIGVPTHVLDQITARESEELRRRETAYRGSRPPEPIVGRTVILVDDGLATGASMRAGVLALRREGATRIVVAVPVAAAATCEGLRLEVEEVVCASIPEPFTAVGAWYEDFRQTTDEEVRELLDRANAAKEVEHGDHAHHGR
jgi:putative phosphoribosyl transferase